MLRLHRLQGLHQLTGVKGPNQLTGMKGSNQLTGIKGLHLLRLLTRLNGRWKNRGCCFFAILDSIFAILIRFAGMEAGMQATGGFESLTETPDK